jgi:signal transduction histidine kinase
MTARTRTRLAVALWIVLVLVLAATIALSVRNGSFHSDPGFIGLAIAMIVGYGTVGAFVVARAQGNSIGLLMMAVGGIYVLTGFTNEYATYAYQTSPGSYPGRLVAAWAGNWLFILVFAPIPLLLLLFPTGRTLSPRWRPLPAITAAAFALAIIVSILWPGPIQVGNGAGIPVRNPTGVPALRTSLHIVFPIVAIAAVALSILAAVSLVLRFRRAGGEERQQIRWFAYIAGLSVVLFLLSLLSSIGQHANQTRFLTNVFVYGFLACLSIGIPVAAGVAILKYRLWDLDVVVKKTIVAAVLVVLITAVALIMLALVGGLIVAPLSSSPAATLVAGLAVGLAFWPLRRLARRIADRLVYGRRASPYEVLSEFSERMAETYSTQDVLARMANLLQGATGAKTSTVWLRVGTEFRPAAVWPAEGEAPPASAARGDGLPPLPGDLAAEVRDQGELLGALAVSMPANDPLDPARERIVRDLAGQAGLVLRNVRLIEELRASRQRLVKAQDEERRKLERDIHDGAQQQLVAMAVKLRLADSMVDRDPTKARELIGQLQGETDEALRDLRDLARGIYPPLLADKGLSAAVEAQARKSPVPVDVTTEGIGRFPQDVEAAVYFCVLEGLQNAIKHAGPTTARIRLESTNGRLMFEIADDGKGFDRSQTAAGTGLQGMIDRLDAIGGSLDVRSSPGEGTTLTGRVPVGSRA